MSGMSGKPGSGSPERQFAALGELVDCVCIKPLLGTEYGVGDRNRERVQHTTTVCRMRKLFRMWSRRHTRHSRLVISRAALPLPSLTRAPPFLPNLAPGNVSAWYSWENCRGRTTYVRWGRYCFRLPSAILPTIRSTQVVYKTKGLGDLSVFLSFLSSWYKLFLFPAFSRVLF